MLSNNLPSGNFNAVIAIAPSFLLSLNKETGFLMFIAQIFGEFRKETRFLISQEKRDR